MTDKTFMGSPARGVAALFAAPALATLTACASVRPAEMALPAALAVATPEPVQGIGAGRSGAFTLGNERGTFQRGLDRLDIFELASFDRARTRYTLTQAEGTAVQASCLGRQTTVTLGALAGRPTPFVLECQWNGASAARMTVEAPSWMPGSRAERRGRYTAAGVTLELTSVHRVTGSALELESPIGYTFLHAGQPVGAIELNGATPRLWRPDASSALREPVTLAALALALLWDPADAAP